MAFTLCTQDKTESWRRGSFEVQIRAEHVVAVVPTVPPSECVVILFSSGGRAAVPGTVGEVKDRLNADGP